MTSPPVTPPPQGTSLRFDLTKRGKNYSLTKHSFLRSRGFVRSLYGHRLFSSQTMFSPLLPKGGTFFFFLPAVKRPVWVRPRRCGGPPRPLGVSLCGGPAAMNNKAIFRPATATFDGLQAPRPLLLPIFLSVSSAPFSPLPPSSDLKLCSPFFFVWPANICAPWEASPKTGCPFVFLGSNGWCYLRRLFLGPVPRCLCLDFAWTRAVVFSWFQRDFNYLFGTC